MDHHPGRSELNNDAKDTKGDGAARWVPPVPPVPPVSPVVALGVCWAVGTGLGLAVGWVGLWLLLTGVAVGLGALAMRRGRWRGAGCWGLVGAVFVAGAWSGVRGRFVAGDDVGRYVGAERQLARVEGVVVDEPVTKLTAGGHFGRFMHLPPSTSFTLEVESIWAEGAERAEGVEQRASGKLRVWVGQMDHRVRLGDRVRATGWLGGFSEPLNPGEFDYGRYQWGQGVRGRLVLESRGNWELVDRSWYRGVLGRFRGWLGAEAAGSLRLGMGDDDERLAFLDALLLGRRTGAMGRLEEGFRRAGLLHLLSVSGAHLGMVLGLAWLVGRVMFSGPRRAMVVVLVVVVAYVCLVPGRVPVTRAAIMAGVWWLGVVSGRVTRGVDCLALAGVLVLIWRPGDLATAGFQLSFGVVAGMLTLTRPMGRLLWPGLEGPAVKAAYNPWRKLAERGVMFVSANVVAFLVAGPLVAYHFQVVNPMAVVTSVITFPVVFLVMGLGFLKIWVGMVLPSGGMVLGVVMGWVTDLLTGLVTATASWPGAAVELAQGPSVAWVVGVLGMVVAGAMGWFRGRRVALLGAVGLCVGWVLVLSPGSWGLGEAWGRGAWALRVNMLAVGDGSCFLVRVGGSDEGKGRVVMFDCGSFGRPTVGERVVVPALRRLGVERVDTLVVSHADIDHFGGVLAVMDRVPVGRVLMGPQTLAEAGERSFGAVGYLVEEVRRRGVKIEVVSQGWSEDLGGGGRLRVLWPPEGLVAKRGNDTSIVGLVEVGRSRLLLTGDIQDQAISGLLGSGADVRAEVCELPHHGSFVSGSTKWIEAVGPRVALQSTGRSRLGGKDKWGAVLGEMGVERLASAERGMVEVRFDGEGGVSWWSFRGGGWGRDEIKRKGGWGIGTIGVGLSPAGGMPICKGGGETPY